MDEETKQAFAALLARMNEGFERTLNRLESLEKDFANTKGFLVSDSLVASRRWLDLEGRVAELERQSKGNSNGH